MSIKVVQHTSATAAAIRSAGRDSVNAGAQGVDYKGRSGNRRLLSPFAIKSKSKNKIVIGPGYMKIRGRFLCSDPESVEYQLIYPPLHEDQQVFIVAEISTDLAEYVDNNIDSESEGAFRIDVHWSYQVPMDDLDNGIYYMPLYKIACAKITNEETDEVISTYNVVYDLRATLVV